MKFNLHRWLWTLAKERILLNPFFRNRPFLQGATFGLACGLIAIATLSSVAILFELFALIFGGRSNTMWEFVGLIFSLPWPGLFASPNRALPWVLGGIAINLLILGLCRGMYSYFQARHNDQSTQR